MRFKRRLSIRFRQNSS